MYASLTNDVCMGGCWPSVWLGARRWAEGRAGHGMGRIVLAVHTMPLAIHTIPYQIHTMPLPFIPASSIHALALTYGLL